MTIARKDHRCRFCKEVIPAGTDYHRETVGPWVHPDNDGFHECKAHHECLEIFRKVGPDWDWQYPTDRAEWAEMVREAKAKEATS